MSRIPRAALACVALVGCGAPEARPVEPAPAVSASAPVPVQAPVTVAPLQAPRMHTVVRVLAAGEVVKGAGAADLSAIQSLLAAADTTVTTYPAPRATKRALPLAWMRDLARAHAGAVLLANARGPGLDSVLAAAKAGGLTVLAADEVDPWRPRVLGERDGKRVCAVAWNAAKEKDTRVAAADDSRQAKEQIQSALYGARSRDGCHAVVAIVHARTKGRGLALFAAEAGADAVIVHATRPPAPVEVVLTRDGRKVPLFLGVGDLVAGGKKHKRPGWERVGMIADLAFTFAGNDRALDWGYHLAVDDGGRVRVLDPRLDRSIVDRLAAETRGPTDLLGDTCWMDSSGSRCR